MAGAPGIVAAPATAGGGTRLARPVLDFLAVGGASILVLAGVHFAFPLRADLSVLAAIMPWLSVVVNWPHFLLSYQLLYWDRRRALLTRPRFVWAAFVAPGLLATVLGAAIASGSRAALGGCVQAMFFLVGWHYVKQAYGCGLALAAREGYLLAPGEKAVLRWNLYTLWALGFVSVNAAPATYGYEGLTYAALELPRVLLPLAHAAVAGTGVGVVAVCVRKWRRDGTSPPLNGMVAILAIYAWFLPLARHPAGLMLLPLFHGAQYELLALRFARGRAADAAATAGGGTGRLRFAVYVASAVALGALAFAGLPRALDASLPYDRAIFGPTLAMLAITLFINVHHYVIDNVIWRRDDPDVQRYLR